MVKNSMGPWGREVATKPSGNSSLSSRNRYRVAHGVAGWGGGHAEVCRDTERHVRQDVADELTLGGYGDHVGAGIEHQRLELLVAGHGVCL